MVDRSRLLNFILESFNDDELADLILDYFPDARPQMGAGLPLSEKARALIDFAGQHGRLDHLVTVVGKLRAEAYAAFFGTNPELPPDPVAAPRDPNRIFISYASADAGFAGRLAADLRAQGYDIWIAPDSVVPGEKWGAAIERGLRESGIFLLVLTPESADSKGVSQETQVAIMLENEGKMRVYPLRVRRADVPLLLATRQYISFEVDYDRGLRALLTILRPGNTKPLPPPLPAPPAPATATPPAADGDYPVLIIDWPDQPLREIALRRAATSVGRDGDNDIVVDLPAISGRHLRLETVSEGRGYHVNIVDLGSQNGTYVGGRRLTPNVPQRWEPGAVVRLGDSNGQAVTLALQPALASALVALPAPAAVAEPGQPPVPTPVAATPRPPSELPPPDLLPGTPSLLSRVPMWAWAVAGLLLVAVLALLLLRPGGAPEATAPATAAAGVDLLPTATGTATVAPTSSPTLAPTATATATAQPTDEPTAVPTNTPVPRPTALPTTAPDFAISSDIALGFETAGVWQRDELYSRAGGAALITPDQANSGDHSLQLAYDFPTGGDDFVIFMAAQGYPIRDDRERRIVRLWVRSDGAPLMLSALIEDSEAELWQVFLDQLSGTEWTQLDGYIGDTTWPSGVVRNAGNGEVDFPIRLVGFLLDDATPSFAGEGMIFVDDVTAE